MQFLFLYIIYDLIMQRGLAVLSFLLPHIWLFFVLEQMSVAKKRGVNKLKNRKKKC